MVSVRHGLLALDIETTGLDAARDRVLTIGLVGIGGSEALMDDEEAILRRAEARIARLPGDAMVVTWNGEEFDMPFLAARFRRLGVRTTLSIQPMGQTGKYGKELYRARWSDHRHLDIAPYFKAIAAGRSVPCSLKPVARAVLNIEPVEVDRRGEAIEALARTNPSALADYVLSDARITLALAESSRAAWEPDLIPTVG
jgi:DNA polymerase elongation subunit (family B)